MDHTEKKLAFSELRIASYKKGPEREFSNEELAKAMTVNENLLTLGYTLRPADLANLATSPSINSFYDEIRSYVGTVDADPMYPDFPSQVMEMNEAMYRMDQLIHYMSTYGMESYFGGKVKTGWLPNPESEEKVEKDTTLLQAKMLELVEDKRLSEEVLSRILSKKEEMTGPEKKLVQAAVKDVNPDFFTSLNIPFKRNQFTIFNEVMGLDDKERAKDILHNVCQHTGDVLKCMDYYLTQKDFHLKTSEKKAIVKLLESYPAVDFKSNLILSAKKAQRSTLMLQYLDYNKFSRSPEHKTAVAQLRNGELRSWESQAKYLLNNDKEQALSFISQRPGMLLRTTAWMLRMGYDKEAITEQLCEKADKLSLPTLNAVLNSFADGRNKDVTDIMTAAMQAKMASLETPFYQKKVYLAMDEFNLDQSSIQKDRSDEGGYVRNGIAYKIPEIASAVRFFVYWDDDKDRVDVDLHVNATTVNGEEIHIGWNGDFRNNGVVMSGDITHSNAAEYIDINLNETKVSKAYLTIELFDGKNSFRDIETCFAGVMAVDKLGQEVKLYDPENCFFSHDLKSAGQVMSYGCIDVEHNCLVFSGKEIAERTETAVPEHFFSLREYIDIMMDAQKATLVDDREQADIVLSMGKEEGCVSLIDNNFFLDQPSVSPLTPVQQEREVQDASIESLENDRMDDREENSNIIVFEDYLLNR